MATGFEDVLEAYDVALDIGIWVLNAVAHSSLGREVDDNVELVFRKEFVNECLVDDTTFDESPAVGYWLLAFCSIWRKRYSLSEGS